MDWEHGRQAAALMSLGENPISELCSKCITGGKKEKKGLLLCFICCFVGIRTDDSPDKLVGTLLTKCKLSLQKNIKLMVQSSISPRP